MEADALPETRVIDCAVRFLRTNPEVMAYAASAAPATGLGIDAILADAVRRLRSSAEPEQPVAQKEVIA
jgi:hypothetical protein